MDLNSISRSVCWGYTGRGGKHGRNVMRTRVVLSLVLIAHKDRGWRINVPALSMYTHPSDMLDDKHLCHGHAPNEAINRPRKVTLSSWDYYLYMQVFYVQPYVQVL